MYSTGDAIKMTQGLLGDPRGQWVTRAYILPFLNIGYGLVNLNLKNASGKNIEAVVPIPGVEAGVSSLYPWQGANLKPGDAAADAKPPALLRGLFDVLEVWAKPAGSGVQMFSQLRERGTLPHVDPAAISTNSFGSGMYFCWMGNRLLVTPVNQPLDFEVTGKFNPTPLVTDDDLLCTDEDIWIPTCFETACLAGVERSNPAVLGGYSVKSVAAQDNIIASIMRGAQSAPTRFKKISRQGGLSQWYWT